MRNNQEDYYSIQDIVRVTKSYFFFVVRKWWVLLLSIVLGGSIGVVYFFKQKPKYDGICTFILEEKSGGISGLGSIASQFGFDMGSLSGGASIFAGDNILDILQSKAVVQEVLLSDIKSGQNNETLADLYLDFTKMKDRWKKRPELFNIRFEHITVPMNSVTDSVLNIIYDQVIKKNLVTDRVNKKGTIIKVEVISGNVVFSKLMAERLVQAASKMYLNVKTGTAKTNIDLLQRRSDSLLALLNNKSFAAASVQPLDVNPGIKTATVPVELATRDKTVIATLYTEVTKNLEMSKLLLSQQTPVIQLLDTPGASMYDNKRSLFFLTIVSSFIAGVIGLGLLSLIYFGNRQKINPLY